MKDVLYIYNVNGPELKSGNDANTLIGDAMGQDARWVVIPAARLSPDFFQLRSGFAGEFVQKFVNLGLGLAIVGDVSKYTAENSALQAFVLESNRGRQLWFVGSVEELRQRLR